MDQKDRAALLDKAPTKSGVRHFENHLFQDCAVDLDAGHFQNCKFHRVVLCYSGGPPPEMTNCSFQDATFRFLGPAERTLGFLKSMSAPGSGLQSLVRNTFATIFGH